MKSFFIILGFLAAAASAGVLPGYIYEAGVSGGHKEHTHVTSTQGHVTSTSNTHTVSTGNTQQGSTTINFGLEALNSVPQTVEYSRQFYHFDAPEEVQEEAKVTKQLSNVLKKNLQVVFINAPENTAAMNAALQLAKQAIEQRTAIYVLTKQNDGAQLVGQLQQIQENVQTAPEVRFVKYRTAEDAQRAKAEIQSQYDNFGGESENFNGGVAPVLNYASAGTPSQIVIGGSTHTTGTVSTHETSHQTINKNHLETTSTSGSTVHHTSTGASSTASPGLEYLPPTL